MLGLVAALAGATLAGAGCDGRFRAAPDDQAAPGGASSGRPVDSQLIAFLSKARAAHHKADIAEKEGNVGAAIEHLSAIVDGPVPPMTPEVAEVLADAYARLADLESRVMRFDDAVFDVEQGLGFSPDVTYFRGHLLEVLGVVEERRMSALEAEGDAAGASAARESALEAFDQAMRVQDEVIQRALEPTSGD
jgi:hypothetical protein